jgi:hypothetical protein
MMDGMMNGLMGAGAVVWILIVVVLVLAAVTLAKYIFRG